MTLVHPYEPGPKLGPVRRVGDIGKPVLDGGVESMLALDSEHRGTIDRSWPREGARSRAASRTPRPVSSTDRHPASTRHDDALELGRQDDRSGGVR